MTQEQYNFEKFQKDIVKDYFSGHILEQSREVINREYIKALKGGAKCSQAILKVADELGCSKRTVLRCIYKS
ncbi:unnamed protein product [marine sediment metagenome]|uniref:Helix-turn-helix domain-containing protein n=1 Tax=marine sediment metagenome TaxID=412755 RepID=X1CLZ5_9ZZZZ